MHFELPLRLYVKLDRFNERLWRLMEMIIALLQDVFLPYVENGTITLIGATTENPSFSLNSALLSRCTETSMPFRSSIDAFTQTDHLSL